MLTASEIIKKYLAFFEKRGHSVIPNASLIPQNDPTTLFINSGMQPLVPYLLGETHPLGKKLVDVQNCFRAQDIEEIGDNRHTTFFRMLGNWSLGDYFKKEQIPWLFEFLTSKEEGLGLDPERLYVTAFDGDERFTVIEGGKPQNLTPDVEAYSLWAELFNIQNDNEAKKEKIRYYGPEKNWWSRAGTPDKMPIGEPGGPDSEVFYDFGKELKIHENSKFKDQKCHPNCDCGRFMEICNSVFMQYRKIDEKTFEELPNKNVDFGGGLERFLAAVEDQQDVFKTSLFSPIIDAIEQITNKKYKDHSKKMRIIADHLTSAIFIINNGIIPSNKEQGYILRRLIRRAFDNINLIRGVENMMVPTRAITETIIEQYKNTDSELEQNAEMIVNTVLQETNKYRFALDEAIKFVKKKYQIGDDLMGEKKISAEDAFVLYTTHGLSPTQIKSLGYIFDDQEFAAKMEAHQNLSREGAKQKFAGGLADHQEQTIMGHTATHLMHQALRDILGDMVHQTGSNITTERLRFDFNYDKKLTDEEIKKVEDIVNEKITDNLPVHFEMMPLKKAKELGAIGLFDDKYHDQVKIYFIGGEGPSTHPQDVRARSGRPYSVEFCGGPHVDFTGKVKKFTIIKQENLGKGQRRIYARAG